MIYLDSSALLKLLLPAAESGALTRWLAGPDRGPRTSSDLAVVECARAIRSAHADGRVASNVLDDQLRASSRLIANLDLVPVTVSILEAAAALSTGRLRSLDAIHVASAARYREELSAIVTYDTRMFDAAIAEGLPVVSPA